MIYPRADSDLRLKQAVRRHRTLSREGLLERLFERARRRRRRIVLPEVGDERILEAARRLKDWPRARTDSS